MKKRMTPQEQSEHDLRERLIAHYESLKAKAIQENGGEERGSGKTQQILAASIPISVSVLNPLLNRQRPIKGLVAIAVRVYLDRMEE